MDIKKYREWSKERKKKRVICKFIGECHCVPDEPVGKNPNTHCSDCFDKDEKRKSK